MELIVTDLAKSREFYVDALGLVVTYEDDEVIYLRSFEEFIHHTTSSFVRATRLRCACSLTACARPKT